MLSDRMAHAAPHILLVAMGAIALAGCQHNRPERDPLPYSPNYHYIVQGNDGIVRKGYDQPAARLVPDACVTPDVAADPLYLPPGCANNLNLQMMVERESDLIYGRSTGPAMAAPVVDAAVNAMNNRRSQEWEGIPNTSVGNDQ